MRSYRAQLKERDLEALLLAKEFLRKRMQAKATLDWALALKPGDTVKRAAIVELVTGHGAVPAREPWRSAWRLLTQSWEQSREGSRNDGSVHDLVRRLGQGERSSSWIEALVQHVMPRLEVKEFDGIHRHFLRVPKRPRKASHLFQIELSRSPLVDPGILDQHKLDASFLRSLARALDSAVLDGIELAASIGWDGEVGLGQLSQVRSFPKDEDPDQFSQGRVGALAPSVKLLHAVVLRLVALKVEFAIEFVRGWRATDSSIHLRLWSSLSCDSRVTPISEVLDLLVSLPHSRFWDDYRYPEIAQLRATRFKDLDRDGQGRILRRILRLPPRSLVPTLDDPTQLETRRASWAATALQHIQNAGGGLSDSARTWLEQQQNRFPELKQMNGNDGSSRRRRPTFVPPPSPDSQYDLLRGQSRLSTLERALAGERNMDRDDPRGRAEAWIRQPGKATALLDDLDDPSGGASYPTVLSWFYWCHSPNEEAGLPARDLTSECRRGLLITARLSNEMVKGVVGDIGFWLENWRNHALAVSEGFDLWFRIWPIAVAVTNATALTGKQSDGNLGSKEEEYPEQIADKALQSPVGKLVNVFRGICPNLRKEQHPFSSRNKLRTMRDASVSVSGLSSLYTRFQLLLDLSYFHAADKGWTKKHLVEPLLKADKESQLLWHAVARQGYLLPATFELLVDGMLDRVIDGRLSREVRQALMSDLVCGCFSAFLWPSATPVPIIRIQQRLRSVDDDLRANAAEAAHRFVVDVQRPNGTTPSVRLVQGATERFFQEVWPQELSLRSPGISRALASIPAEMPEEFVTAVRAVRRFLVPFDSWSMLEYGLFGDQDGQPRLAVIDKEDKAKALLDLLDLTVGDEGSAVPDDLTDALDQIHKRWRLADKQPAYRRLSALARR